MSMAEEAHKLRLVGSRKPSKRALNVLVVDDDETEIKLIKRTLSRFSDYHVTESFARTASEASALLNAEKFDLCLLDFWLDNETCVRLIQQILREHDIPVILISGFDEDSIRELSQRAGALDFVAKGELSPEVLERKIAKVA